VIVRAREQGASSTIVGIVVACIGVGGLLGAAVATRLARVPPLRRVVVGTLWLEAALVPLLAVAPHPLLLGAVYGSLFVLHPTWNASVGALRIRLTPDNLQGRVASVASLFSLGAVPFGALAVGFAVEAGGTVETLLGIAVVMALVALAAALSRAVRDAPSVY
jgi:predicted MFS family arabinose efflux permease